MVGFFLFILIASKRYTVTNWKNTPNQQLIEIKEIYFNLNKSFIIFDI